MMNQFSFVIDADLSRSVRSFSMRMAVSVEVTVLVATQVLLYRYSEQGEIAVAVPWQREGGSPRDAGTSETPAFRYIHGELRGNPTVATVLAQLRGRIAETDACGEASSAAATGLPLAMLGPGAPNVRVMLAVLNPGDLRPGEPGREYPLWQEESARRFDLILVLSADDREFRGRIGWHPGTLALDQARRLVGHLCSLLASVTADPYARIGSLELLTAEEHREIVAQWRAAEAENGSIEFVHELVSKQAARSPSRIAVSCGASQLTFHELESQANQLAWYLRHRDVVPEAVVGVCLRRTTTLVVTLLAILKAGGAYLPLDPDYPRDRLEFMLRDSGATTLVTQLSEGTILANSCAHVVDIEHEWPLIAKGQTANPEVTVRGGNSAYVVYTSGSTGVPKGVIVQHHGMINHLLWAVRTYSLSDADVTLGFSSMSFDSSVRQIFAPLMTGAKLILLTNDEQMNLRAIVGAISEHRVTAITASFPSMWRELIPYLSKLPRQATALRLTAVGGESFRQMPSGEELSRLGRIYNQYGPTECTVLASYRLMSGPDDLPQSLDEIGKPTSNMRIYVLDGYCQLVPVGVPGEAYIAGSGLARGYLNRPGLTASRFVADPFGGPGERMYRSGDLVRRLPSGHLEFLGRLDEQVKLHGLRIEPGEVESALRAHPAVSDAIVVMENLHGAGSQLRAYVVAQPFETPDSLLLKNYLRDRLPRFMVPDEVTLVDHFPRQPNGKVDRKSLATEITAGLPGAVADNSFVDAWKALF